MASFKRNALRVFLLAVVVFLAAWLVRITDPGELVKTVLLRIENLGPSAPLWFILAYIIACLTFFPGVILTLGGGVLFGVVKGTLYVSIGATLGAGCAFLISRYLAREWVSRKFAEHPKFRALDDAVAADGWKIVGLIRLSPVFPFIPLNFLFGLTKIPFPHFFLVTWVSILPQCCMFVYLGTLLGDIAALGTEPIAQGRTKLLLSGVGIIMTVIVTILVSRIAKRALNRVPSLAED